VSEAYPMFKIAGPARSHVIFRKVSAVAPWQSVMPGKCFTDKAKADRFLEQCKKAARSKAANS
jgi:hypothetical protein